MVRETRHLWVGNLPDNIREDRIRDHFKRYGRVQSVKLLPRGNASTTAGPGATAGGKEETNESTMACTVAFMDIKSASKAHNVEHKIDDRTLTTEYYEPAAIPSAASPQNTPSSYATSPGSNRFPNGHGSTEEHTNFGERFYERANNRVNEGEFIRRTTTYHDNCRSRNRDRNYRNGPYNAIMDRSHRTATINNSWSSSSSSYETTGASATTRYNSQNETGYVSTTPSDTNERRSSDQSSTKKKSKSRSPSGSTSSRSPSRSRSRSSSSSSSSSTSRDTSSSSEKRPVAIRVKNLPPRSSDTSLKDGLFHEYKKHGKVTWVKVVGQGPERYAIVCFKKPEDVEKALEVSYDKLFFGCKIEVEPYQGYDVEDNDLRPYEAEIDEFHPKATRTLFIGNLEKDVTASDLRKNFDLFGEIIEIDIKKQGAVGSYAFCQYSDIVSVVKAIRAMDGEHLGNNRIKLGFGKSMPTNCVWVDGVLECNEKYLRIQFEPFGSISKVHVDRDKGQALIFYEQVVAAQLAVNKMRGFTIKGSKIQVDFASRECQESFFEHLEKQGNVLDRTAFEERRDSVSRTFEPTANRFSRYDTPTRPRTSSYSSRSSATTNQVPSAMPSPGTPGSVTPRTTGSRSRVARFTEFYDPNGDFPNDRHFRNYDEFSQESGASHEDVYENDYNYASPSSHVDIVESRTVPNAVNDHATPFVQPDIRNLHKERVHLLEQLEECPSSGDELMAPKKRAKLELLEGTITSDVIIEANRDHRKVMEVRRLSDPNLKHHRRPSVDGSKHREMGHDRSSYLPHAICKRRKTGGSDGGSRSHHYDHSGSESAGGSRPGTPLVDERPENLAPTEPRRVPREREGPITLPLPRFAAQVMNRGSVSVAGIKGQKDSNILASPPPAVTSPRINPKPPSPTPVPPPASPPPRPPSLSSNSSDSDVTPPSPSLDERIRSLNEKYEKWSGSRPLTVTASGEAREKFRLKHKLLDLDLKEVQPSEMFKSVMAKRSVFDEDLKRLENVVDKYEPVEFAPICRIPPNVQPIGPTLPLSAPPILKVIPTTPALPKTPTMLSPRSAGANVPVAKGLQYPFPSHPQPPPLTPTPPPPPPPLPLQQSPQQQQPPLPPPPAASTTLTTTSTIISRGSSNHGADNRLKPCTNIVSSDNNNRTSSKVSVNRSGVVQPSSVSATTKTSDKSNVNSNIPNTTSDCIASVISATTNAASSSSNNNNISSDSKTTVKSVKTSDKVTCRRDSTSGSPRSAVSDLVKSRRNSDASVKKTDDEKYNDSGGGNNACVEKEEKEKKEHQRLEKERLEKEKQEKERLEKEKLERERLERESELEKERLEKERREREEKERREQQEREEREKREEEEQQRLERERQEREKLEKERKREEEKKHKEDNHEKRKEEHKHRENHKESNHIHTKEDKNRDSHSHDKNRHHIERDVERRKESLKENRDNNVHEKTKERIESRHLSVEIERNKNYEIIKVESGKRKERNNSLPANIGLKRRLSSHESIEGVDEAKKIKLNQDHKNLSERRDSKDSTRSEEKSKNKHKNNTKVYDDIKLKHNNIKESEEKRKEREERHRNKQKTEKHRIKSKSREKECRESPSTPKSPTKELTDKDFLARLELRSTEEVEKQKAKKDKKRLELDDEKKDEMKKSKSKEEKHKFRDENAPAKATSSSDEKKSVKKDRIRNSSDNNSDSDEPKKHSIFDIVDDEPAYISMYDKVKARSCKNMQKQEEEKRKEKIISAKFNQLKQSRAKREEKKRSTSWDEDSESDREKSDHKTKRSSKMLIMSSDDEETSSRRSHKKHEIYSDSDSERLRNVETSEDDRIRKIHRKESKSRITSDTSDDEIKKIQDQIKAEIYSDNEVDQGFADSEEKSFSNRIKKERKHQDSLMEQMNAQIFGDSSSPVERYNNRHSFGENSSGDENVDAKKERGEVRKKHKKKQKRQKHSVSSEECSKLETVVDAILEKSKHHEKKKQHNKKDKKRDKTKEERDKSKKSKKNKSDGKSDSKRDGKMENIFGSLSEDSESGVKEIEQQSIVFLERLETDSDREDKEHRKRKEKKRREKERRLHEAEQQTLNENSMDFADLGKQLEDNIKDDAIEEFVEKSDNFDADDDSFRTDERKEAREKKKKRKKSKEEKQKHHHHHHHHHEKNKIKTEVKKEEIPEVAPPEETAKPQNPSLPNLIDATPSPPQNKSTSSLDFSVSPVLRENLISPIPKTPTTAKEKKREKFLPAFGDIDDKVHENAVKSISEIAKPVEDVKTTESASPAAETPEEKPRVVISQEETEDAVAALLGESFGSGQFDDCYNEEDINSSNDQAATLQQDDEEMRQAVQSLSAGEIDAKPDTPQSENDLQIDTDTEEPEEPSRFEPSAKTSEAPPVPTETQPVVVPKVKTTPPDFYPNLKNPPSLTPIKPIVEESKEIKVSLSLPTIPEAPRSVIAQTWKDLPKSEPVKITTYPPLTALTKQEHPQISSSEASSKIQKVTTSNQENSTPSVTIPTLSRLPITPIMVSKPLQATTVLLPKPKVVQTSEPPVLVPTSEARPRMVLQTSPISPHFPAIVQNVPRRQNFYVGAFIPAVKPETTTAAASTVTTSTTSTTQSITTQATTAYLPTSSTASYIPVQQRIIVSHGQIQMPVIKETPPKLVTITSPPTPPAPPTTTIIQQIKLKEPEKVLEVKEQPEKKPEVVVEEPKQQLAIEKVTEELNLTLKKENVVELKEEDTKEEAKVKVEVKSEPNEIVPKVEEIKPIADEVKVEVKEPDEEKTETESVASDVSKERLRDDPLDTKEDSDYWSAKEVNIDSVIKTLCSADELSDHSSEVGKDEWLDETSKDVTLNKTETEIQAKDEETFDENEEKEISPKSGINRRGGRARGRKTRGVVSAIQTRRAKIIKEPITIVKRGGRVGTRTKSERKSSKSESEDIYEFKDDSDENNVNKERPRLILTIKSPVATSAQPIVKEVAKETVPVKQSPPPPAVLPPAVAAPPPPAPAVENKEEFLSPASNTRKSRRLQERDVLRNTVDDTIEDVVRNTVMVTRSLTNQARRSTRQTTTIINKPPTPETPRKSPRGTKKKDRRASDPSEDSSEEKPKIDTDIKNDGEIKEPTTEIQEKPKDVIEKLEVKEKPLEGLKAKMLRRVKGEMQEPMNLIDPVTGLLTPMRECEEGKYIPLPKSAPNNNQQMSQKTVITTTSAPHPSVHLTQIQTKQKPQSLKAHVLSSQAAKAVVVQTPVVQQQPPQQLIQHSQPQQVLQIKKPSVVTVTSTTPLSQSLNINVSMAAANYTTAHMSPRTNMPVNVLSKALTGTKPSPMSPIISSQAKQQMLISKPMPQVVPQNTQLINTHVAHLKPQQQQQQPVINKAKSLHNMHQQQIMTGSVASPPLGLVAGGNQQNRIVQGPALPKGVMEPPKIDVSAANVILAGPRLNLSPQGQPRHVTQPGMPVPAYEATLGEAIAHFPPGAVPLRPPHDLPPGHYMHHPSHVMQYKFLHGAYHLPRSPMVGGGIEKSGDGQEGEEAPVTSPPLELRRPGSVGLALTGRTAVVPHSLHSPHDRTTDSPQVGQMYGMHTARMQHYHSPAAGRFYDQPAEPPPAHRPLTSHGSLTAHANDRSISHMASLGAPERPLSSHSALSAHNMGMGAGLGAAGNLMGAVARHVGVDAPTSQRGLQAATPPHASQVPPQAESLFMLLKQYPCMWQGLLALKNDQAAVQMYFVSGNDSVAKLSLPKNNDGSTPPLRIFQRMRLEPPQVEGVARKMQMENEHCMLLALPCGHDHVDVLKQSTNLTNGFITYLQQKQAAGIVNVAAPGTTQPPAYVVHIFPSCDFVNENLRRIAPSLLERVADIAHLLIVITTV